MQSLGDMFGMYMICVRHFVDFSGCLVYISKEQESYKVIEGYVVLAMTN